MKHYFLAPMTDQRGPGTHLGMPVTAKYGLQLWHLEGLQATYMPSLSTGN